MAFSSDIGFGSLANQQPSRHFVLPIGRNGGSKVGASYLEYIWVPEANFDPQNTFNAMGNSESQSKPIVPSDGIEGTALYFVRQRSVDIHEVELGQREFWQLHSDGGFGAKIGSICSLLSGLKGGLHELLLGFHQSRLRLGSDHQGASRFRSSLAVFPASRVSSHRLLVESESLHVKIAITIVAMTVTALPMISTQSFGGALSLPSFR